MPPPLGEVFPTRPACPCRRATPPPAPCQTKCPHAPRPPPVRLNAPRVVAFRIASDNCNFFEKKRLRRTGACAILRPRQHDTSELNSVVECHLAKVDVEGPNPLARSNFLCHGSIAQLVEQVTLNHWVVGSNPSTPTIAHPPETWTKANVYGGFLYLAGFGCVRACPPPIPRTNHHHKITTAFRRASLERLAVRPRPSPTSRRDPTWAWTARFTNRRRK